MDILTEIAKTLKSAREAKGLSQHALARIAGVPQSHISKIEAAGVDLRTSSLTVLARALDLELTLVPRKSVPAVDSIVRSTQASAQRPSMSMRKALAKLESASEKIVRQHGSVKEAVQLQNRLRELSRIGVPLTYRKEIEALATQLLNISNGPKSLKRLIDSLDGAQALRNTLAHSPSERMRELQRSAYSLVDVDDG